jgi:uncharacterized protein
VDAILANLAEGATVPFLARYRQEQTGVLTEDQIRAVRDHAGLLQELVERKQTVLRKLESQGQLTDELEQAIWDSRSRPELEDLYLPYRPKKRSRAAAARDKGLEPLALLIGQQGDDQTPEQAAAPFSGEGQPSATADEALAGARDILAEAVAHRADVSNAVGDHLRQSNLTVTATDKQDLSKTKYREYATFQAPAATVRAQRYLAICRGEAEKKLRLRFEVELEDMEQELTTLVGLRPTSPMADQLRLAVRQALERWVFPTAIREVRNELRQRAEQTAMDVFASNLKDLLMTPPLGAKPVVAVDPGVKTECKVVAVDETGQLVASHHCHLAHKQEGVEAALTAVRGLVDQVQAVAIAVGTGPGGREALAQLRRAFPADSKVAIVPISEAGASVYSASRTAKKELPNVDVTLRGAVSLARRLQDPLAELVKIDPRSVGVGQFQHDVDGRVLRARLADVIESCVSAVGVDLNRASSSLLRYVPGLGPQLAERIVEYRNHKGPFSVRQDIQQVNGVTEKIYQQAAGFLRITDGAQPLDRTAIHPEHYALVDRMAQDQGCAAGDLIASPLLDSIELATYVDDELGKGTVRAILKQLRKPGQDPRPPFEPPTWREDVSSIDDLKVDMELQGIVTNVTDFGAFLDVGAQQDGLVHISQLSDRFVSDPREVVSVGQRLTVRVIEVDLERKRISLSAKAKAKTEGRRGAGKGSGRKHRPSAPPGPRPRRGKSQKPTKETKTRGQSGFGYTPFADFVERLGKK